MERKEEFTGLVVLKEYGHIKVKLPELLEEKGLTRNKLANLIGTKYDTINRYYKKDEITMVDIDLFARICCVLKCEISDLLEYVNE